MHKTFIATALALGMCLPVYAEQFSNSNSDSNGVTRRRSGGSRGRHEVSRSPRPDVLSGRGDVGPPWPTAATPHACHVFGDRQGRSFVLPRLPCPARSRRLSRRAGLAPLLFPPCPVPAH